MFGHGNIFLFCSVPVEKREIYFHILSPESERVLLIISKGFECGIKVILKLSALSDHCYCIPEPARCCCVLEPPAPGTGDLWEVQGFTSCRMLWEGHISNWKLTIDSLLEKCLKYTTATFLQSSLTFR